jgi:Fe-Mn family superoxide dismutase
LALIAAGGCALPPGDAQHAVADASALVTHGNEFDGIESLAPMPLPFAVEGLAPVLSATTLQLHHGKHHQAYVDFLKRAETARPGTVSARSLRQLVVEAQRSGVEGRALYQNAAQHFNHCIQWLSLSPKGGGAPPHKVADALSRSFGGVEQFHRAWLDQAINLFGSGWLWLVHDVASDGLAIVPTLNADTPITRPGLTVLANIDVWEHAYYVDYPAARKAYVQAVMAKLFNWRLVDAQLDQVSRVRQQGAIT